MKLILAVLVASLAGCASSYVLVGTARAPITPDQVKIYLQPPPKYEQIAVLESSSSGSFEFTSQGKTDKVIERLKAQAAKLGANGVLLQGIGDRQVGSFGNGVGSASVSGNSAFGFGLGASTGIYQKNGSGTAIYVPQ